MGMENGNQTLLIVISSFQCTLLFPKYCEPVDNGDSESRI